MFQQEFAEIAPCLSEGPIVQSGQALVEAAESLGNSAVASSLRAWSVVYAFEHMEAAFASNQDPVPLLNRSFEALAAYFRASAASGITALHETQHDFAATDLPVEKVTGQHYGNLFQAFSPTSYWDEPVKLLRARLERNGVSIDSIQNKSLLDGGCGGGRYTAAWRLLGARPVTGLDVSEIGLGDAQKRVNEAGMTDIQFKQGSVLDIPFEDNSFDISFSNGVLHHTTDWKQGIHEMVRVLKPGGLGWLYLIENPGGLFWDTIEILRVIMRNEQKNNARLALAQVGVPANRIFYMLDHVMVPINVRLTPQQIEDELRAAGATDIRRLLRGTDFDRVEQIYQKQPYAEVKYGAGENRYLFSKA